MMRSTILTVLGSVTLVLSAPAGSAVGQECPESCIYAAGPVCSTAPINSSSTGGGHGWGPSSGRYNLTGGTLEATADYSVLWGSNARVDIADDYRVLGVAPG